MDAEWYYAVGADRFGPFSRAQVEGLVRSGALRPDALVWHSALDAWSPAWAALGLRREPPPVPVPARAADALPQASGGPAYRPFEGVSGLQWAAAAASAVQLVFVLGIFFEVPGPLIVLYVPVAWAVLFGPFALHRHPTLGRRAALTGSALTAAFAALVLLDGAGHSIREVEQRATLALLAALAELALVLRETRRRKREGAA